MFTRAACQRSPKSNPVSAFASSTLIIRGYGLSGWAGACGCVCGVSPNGWGKGWCMCVSPRDRVSLCVCVCFPGVVCVPLPPSPRTYVRVALPRRLSPCASQVFMDLSFPGCLRASSRCLGVSPRVPACLGVCPSPRVVWVWELVFSPASVSRRQEATSRPPSRDGRLPRGPAQPRPGCPRARPHSGPMSPPRP